MRIGTKLALATVVVLVAVNSLLFYQLSRHERERLVSSKAAAASMLADLLASSLSAPLDFDDPESVQAEVANLQANAGIHCALAWHSNKPEVIAKLDRGGCAHALQVGGKAGDRLDVFPDRVEVFHSVVGRGKTVGSCALTLSLGAENAAYDAARRQAFWFLLALAVGASALLLLIARVQIVLPLRKLVVAAGRIGKGRFETEITVASNDEVGELAQAFNRMRGQLADREEHLVAARRDLKDLFDHMRQGIIAFGRDGRVAGPVSRAAARLFRVESLQQRQVHELLYGDDQAGPEWEAFNEWTRKAFDVDPSHWEQFVELAPREAIISTEKSEVPVELEFQPIVKGNSIERVMLLVTDVTKQRELERTVRSQEKALKHTMDLLAGGGHVFVTFVETAGERISRCKEVIREASGAVKAAEVDELFRHVHTIKGEARAFGMDKIEERSAQIEDQLEVLRAKIRGADVDDTTIGTQLPGELDDLEVALREAVELYAHASPIGRLALKQTTVLRDDLEALDQVAEELRIPTVQRIARRLAGRPFGEAAARLVETAPTWAAELGKRVRIEVEGREERVCAKLARILPSVLTTLVRNSVAHGIEPVGIRESSGKPETGIIRIVAATLPGSDGVPVIILQDDGRGIDLAAIAERAGKSRVGASEEELNAILFSAGVSTAEARNSLAGRGVGLLAVRVDLEGVGYVIRASTMPGKYTRFVLRPI